MTGHIDLIIRNGTVFDGLGHEPVEADVAIHDGRIVAIGAVAQAGTEEIDARGKIVTPGFVDIHTHYDGHAVWANRLNPSSAHGVTSVVMGNCGVGFAPCRPADHEALIQLMEGVEDIPEVVMAEGLTWEWETFEDYLDCLAGRQYDMDIAAQLPHAPLRVYVMGERGVNREPATADDIARMRQMATAAMRAGALGFSTSRSINHKASDGRPTPSLGCAEDELVGIALGLRDAGSGLLEFISDFDDVDAEFDLVERMVAQSGRPLTLSLIQFPHVPDRWRAILDRIERAQSKGLDIRGQICGRPIGTMAGLSTSFNPFSFCPAYQAIAHLPLPERVAALRDVSLRARILSEFPGDSTHPAARTLARLDNMFVMGDNPDYEPDLSGSIAAQAAARGLSPAEYVYDLLLTDDGKVIFYLPATNYVSGTADVMETMVKHPHTLYGLGDGGAHCGLICDASLTTHMLANWAKRTDGRAVPLPEVIRRLTSANARAMRLNDRGVLAPGYRADLNVIDFDRIALRRPEMVRDLPKGGSRLHQRADGYAATIVAGQVTYRDGAATGALPGRLVRGVQGAPQAA